MFKNTYQSGLLSIFYSCGANPLSIWNMEVHNGHVKRVTDNEVNSIVLEIVSVNVATTYISCPKEPSQVLGIKLPFLVMIVKNLKRYFSFEITILDDKNMRRRFRISNFQSTTKIKPFCTTMPIGLSGGWNQIQFNLADFTRRAYGSVYIETLRVQVHANTRLRRIYFADCLYSEEDLPQEYKLYLPLDKKKKAKEVPKKEVKVENAEAAPSEVPPQVEKPVELAAPKTEIPSTPVKEEEPATPAIAEAEPAAEAEAAEGEAEEAVESSAEGEEGVVVDEAEAQAEPAAGEEGEEPAEEPQPATEETEAAPETTEEVPEEAVEA